MTQYSIGVGKADITDDRKGLGMIGWADCAQKTESVLYSLSSRAFAVFDGATYLMIVSAEIWACTKTLKDEVLKKLAGKCDGVYTENNLLLSGVHTHSAPGGYAGGLYDIPHLIENTLYGKKTLKIMSDGIVSSIVEAHNNLALGKIYINKGNVDNCGKNRSPKAYNANIDAASFTETDQEMLLLKFVQTKQDGSEQAVGMLNWYAIHPTDMGQQNKRVCGDNKGRASMFFEEQKQGVIGAFANANCGDVSGNVGRDPKHDNDLDLEFMDQHAHQQNDVAMDLFDHATEEITGPLSFQYKVIDMSNIEINDGSSARTYSGALGVSFGAGSTADGYTDFPIGEGVNTDSVLGKSIMELSKLIFNLDDDYVLNQMKKPILLPTGNLKAADMEKVHQLYKELKNVEDLRGEEFPLLEFIGKKLINTPNRVPIQLIQIGTLVLTGFPGELTTMAGRRLKKAVLDATKSIGVKHLASATYSNEYSQYTTTEEEYHTQYYEAASTLFGPHQLAAYCQEYCKLAKDLINE